MLIITTGLLLVISLIICVILVQKNRKLKIDLLDLTQSLNTIETARKKIDLQLNAVLSLTHEYNEARDENQIIEKLISKSMEVAGALGGSFVPLDDNGLPMAAIHKGGFPFPVPNAWLEYLASPSVRKQCQMCLTREATDRNCNLLKGPFHNAEGIYCFPLRYGKKELGLLNIYLPEAMRIDPYIRDFIQSITEATALALESERLRHREIQTISQLGQVRQKQDLEMVLTGVLENLNKALDAEFSLCVINWRDDFTITDFLNSKQVNMSGVFESDLQANLSDILSRISINEFRDQFTESYKVDQESVHWLGLPVTYSNHSRRGWLFLACRQPEQFSQRKILLAQSVANKISLLIQNADSMAGIEYTILMEERTRLAREIHDGLAQTLGFLKLQVAQMIGFLDRDDVDRLRQSLQMSYDALAEAYQDARISIDGLRISPENESGYNLLRWLNQIVEDYAGILMDIKIQCDEITADLPPEMHAQLIRIVQEALSNIRKHAQAKQVKIICSQRNNNLVLEVHDDGIGFTPSDIPNPSRYGLKGMKERTELLGADFQIISCPGEGTVIRVIIPLEKQNWMEV